MANVGVANRTDTCPNTLRGSIPSRPIANRIRDTDACDVSAEPMHPATYAAVKKMFRKFPPAGEHDVDRADVGIVEGVRWEHQLRDVGQPE